MASVRPPQSMTFRTLRMPIDTSDIALGQRWCRSCGAAFGETALHCARCGAPTPAIRPRVPARSCPACEIALSPYAAYCAECGVDLQFARTTEARRRGVQTTPGTYPPIRPSHRRNVVAVQQALGTWAIICWVYAIVSLTNPGWYALAIMSTVLLSAVWRR